MVILWHTSTAAWLVSTTHTFTSTVPTATRTSSSALRRLPFPSCLSLGCFAASSGVMEYLSISCLWLGQVDVRGHHPAKDVSWTCHLSRSLKTRPCQPLRPPPGGALPDGRHARDAECFETREAGSLAVSAVDSLRSFETATRERRPVGPPSVPISPNGPLLLTFRTSR